MLFPVLLGIRNCTKPGLCSSSLFKRTSYPSCNVVFVLRVLWMRLWAQCFPFLNSLVLVMAHFFKFKNFLRPGSKIQVWFYVHVTHFPMLQRVYRCRVRPCLYRFHKFDLLWERKGWELVKHPRESLTLHKTSWGKKAHPLYQLGKWVTLYEPMPKASSWD
jgi:hypothetical protein